ncbi:ubiquitin ligase SCF complex subunit Cullin [Ephemerocybe angulata]|uniref:Ubiquitin ligase SCF complex subunit Cullin n=1 Tax=Ephemerocybe angulata TaxID=980116 RepID=A0A8H6HWF9_9AGAR|nr:ubiquitin ligase SCF complex subunit Cullin [Tulosesus angulatus]
MSTARRGRPKIKPPKKHGQEFSAERTWLALSKSIKEVQNHNAANLSFEENYRYAYNMVLHKKDEMLYNGVSALVAEHLDTLAEEHIIPRFPAGSIGDPIQRSQADELLLKGLKDVWDDHESSMTKLGQLLKYMDRIYPEKAHVPTTWVKGLELFLVHIIKTPIKDHLVTAILKQVQHEREGYVINRSAVKGCVDVFHRLETDHGTVYKTELEKKFLEESETFYKSEAQHLLSTCECPEYLRRVESRYQSEDSRIHHYLSPQTGPGLRKILEDTLLIPNLSTVISMPNSGLDSMIDTDKFDDLARLYRLYLPVQGGLSCLKRTLRESINRRGKDLNDISLGVGGGDGEGEEGQEEEGSKRKEKGKAKARPPPGALPAIKVWRDSFKSDREVEASLNEAFESFVNNHPKAPEYTSLFIDDHLKRGIKGFTEAEVDAILDKTITVFRYISDKDVFERYYKGHLAKRLLHKRSVSDDAERGMLSKLKIESGYQFTSKLEGMFNDIKLSGDAMDEYRKVLETRTAPSVDINVTVMTATFWPFSAPNAAPLMPEILSEACKSYEAFYFSRHSGRRLTWLTSQGNADLRATFRSRSHELNVSTHALMILLLFEDLGDDDFLTYSVQIEESDLKRNLQSLACAKYKILRKHPHGREIDVDDSFSFNVDFQASIQKIKISTVSSKPETPQERKETHDRIEEERKHQIDACVVRIMKDRKHMGHNELVNEVTRQLASRFNPDPLAIKKRIEALIEREYLERCEDRKSYNYMACIVSTPS